MNETSEVPRGIDDYCLLVAATQVELESRVAEMENEGWTRLGSSAHLRRGAEYSRSVYIQPMVVYRVTAPAAEHNSGAPEVAPVS